MRCRIRRAHETWSIGTTPMRSSYVLEGQIVMQLKGQPAVTLTAGQTFYEGPTDVHVVGRNASNTEPARFVVVLLKAKGAPILTPVKDDSHQSGGTLCAAGPR